MSRTWLSRAATLAAIALALSSLTIPAHADTPVMWVVGDSYPAGDGPGRAHAFPAVAAAIAGYDVVNQAAGGSKSGSIVGQLEGSTDADVVVINTGGNDVDALSTLPDVLAGNSAGFIGRMGGLRANLDAAFTGAQAQAPGAEFYVVNYPNFLGSCVPGDVAGANRAADALNGTIADAAGAAGFTLVDVSGAFAGHTVCDGEPWVTNYHPNAAGHQAIGEQLASVLAGEPVTAERRVAALDDSTASVPDDTPAVEVSEEDWLSFLWEHRAEIEELVGDKSAW